MSYIAILKRKTRTHVDPFDDVTWGEGKLIIPEKWDNPGEQTSLRVTGVWQCAKPKETAGYKNILDGKSFKFDFTVTDSRVTFRCKKWASTNNPIILIFNILGKIGKVYGGHIRYEWLLGIEYSPKQGWLDKNQLRLYYQDTDETNYYVQINLHKNIDAAELAHDILRRASHYRLARKDEKSEKTREFLQKNAEKPEIQTSAAPKEFSGIWFPSFFMAPLGGDNRP